MSWLALIPLGFACPSSLTAIRTAPIVRSPVGQGEPKDFWWNDKPPPLECAPPIIPEHWLVVPNGVAFSSAQVFMRHLLNPGRVPPAIDADPRGERIWQSVQARSFSNVTAAYTCIASKRNEVRMAHLTGAEQLFVNGEGFVGDPRTRGHRGVPVALRKGDNHLFVLGIAGPVELELWVPETRAVLGAWDVAWPGEIPTADDFAYPVFNASTEIGENLHVHYGHAVVEGSTCAPVITDWRCGGTIVPLGVMMAGSYFTGFDQKCDPTSDEQAALVPICVYFSGDTNPDQRILRRGPLAQIGPPRARPTSRSMAAITGTPLSRLPADTVCLIYSEETLARARMDQQLSWYRTWIAPDAVSDETYVSVTPCENGNYEERRVYTIQRDAAPVLYGNADTNKAWEKFIPSGVIEVREGSLRIGTKEFRGDDICGWFSYQRSRDKSVVVIADTGQRGLRLGYLVQPLFSNAEGLDYAFWDSGGDGGSPRLIASGKFPL